MNYVVPLGKKHCALFLILVARIGNIDVVFRIFVKPLLTEKVIEQASEFKRERCIYRDRKECTSKSNQMPTDYKNNDRESDIRTERFSYKQRLEQIAVYYQERKEYYKKYNDLGWGAARNDKGSESDSDDWSENGNDVEKEYQH